MRGGGGAGGEGGEEEEEEEARRRVWLRGVVQPRAALCWLGPCSQLRGMFTIVEMHLWCRIERLGDVACARLGSRHETALGAEGVLLRSGGPTVLVPSRHRGCGLTNATLCGEVHAGLLLDRRLLRIVISSAAVSGCTSNDSRITLKWKDVPR